VNPPRADHRRIDVAPKLSGSGGYGRELGVGPRSRVDPETGQLPAHLGQALPCRGGELEQIQLLLGHASITTTERYLGTRQNLADAPNDRLGLEWQD